MRFYYWLPFKYSKPAINLCLFSDKFTPDTVLQISARLLVEVLVTTVGAIRLLANVERNVPVLDHVADLALHRQRKQNAEVDQEDWPEHWDVEDAEERAKERNDD